MRFVAASYVVASLCALLLAVSCTPSPNVETDTTTLQASPDTVKLLSAADIKSSNVNLSCNCDFPLVIAAGTGDTAQIHYSTNPVLGKSAPTHTVQFFAAAGTTKGAYAANFDMSGLYDYTNTYLHHTIHVTLNVP